MKSAELYYDLLTLKKPSMRIMYSISRQFSDLLNIKDMSQKDLITIRWHESRDSAVLQCEKWPKRGADLMQCLRRQSGWCGF